MVHKGMEWHMNQLEGYYSNHWKGNDYRVDPERMQRL